MSSFRGRLRDDRLGITTHHQLHRGDTVSSRCTPIDALDIDAVGDFGKGRRTRGRSAWQRNRLPPNDDRSTLGGLRIPANSNDVVGVHYAWHNGFSLGLDDLCCKRDLYFLSNRFELSIANENDPILDRTRFADRLQFRAAYRQRALSEALISGRERTQQKDRESMDGRSG